MLPAGISSALLTPAENVAIEEVTPVRYTPGPADNKAPYKWLHRLFRSKKKYIENSFIWQHQRVDGNKDTFDRRKMLTTFQEMIRLGFPMPQSLYEEYYSGNVSKRFNANKKSKNYLHFLPTKTCYSKVSIAIFFRYILFLHILRISFVDKYFAP